MVEPLFRFAGEMSPGTTVSLSGDEGHHAVSVRRMRAGEAIQLTDGKTKHCRGRVVEVFAKHLTVEIDNVFSITQPALSFILVQALAKGDRDEMAIQMATELGVDEVIPWQASRSVSRWDESKRAKAVARWQSICDEAAKQSLQAKFPIVRTLVDTAWLAQQATLEDSLMLVLDPTASNSIIDVKVPERGRVFLVVGPEGGISEGELSKLESSGAKRVRLGSGILRTSTAGGAALTLLSASSGRWR